MAEMGRCGASPRPHSFVRTAASVVAALAVLAPLAACGSSDDAQASPVTELDDDVITVGSFDFTASAVLAEIYSQGMEAAGYKVHRAFRLGAREFAGSALATGLVEFLPEYAGTASEFYSLGRAEPSDDVAGTHSELVQALQGKNMVALDASPAQDANTFVVTHSTATRLKLVKLSDLQPVAGRLTFGGPPECPTRRQCLAGLIDIYGLKFGQLVTVDAGGPLTHNALQEGLVDVALLFSTDPAIGGNGLVELDDDRGLQPAESVTPLVRSEVVDLLGPDFVAVINAVSARLTTDIVRELNGQASQAGATPRSVAAGWWSEVNA